MSDTLIGIILSLIIAEAGFGAWITSRFDRVTKSVDKLREELLSKIEYHERHDDRRFADMGDNIWELRVRLATLDGGDVFKRRTDHCPDENLPNSQRKDLYKEI